MVFSETVLKGAYVISLEKREDSRGFFARSFCTHEFENYGLDHRIVQINNTLNVYRGTLRGIHYQLPPKAETKIVRCIKGSLYDVILDLRPHSETFGKWCGIELTDQNRKMVYVPKGFGHAFLTLEDNTEIMYFITEFYAPHLERGIRWNDPKFNVEWPFMPAVVSDRDKNFPDFDFRYHLNTS
ncbi:MAG: dTDP-4-dehydrorhamnose 3,5-epimerase [wastewater metagenome]|nr:dTDP-4-dehydrorhamnose 3,5-epimerase [Candidatus Loosdrechtia aerotolerans]